jgi:ubiquinone/menaquinone biosynthesis C-methylase UbiE
MSSREDRWKRAAVDVWTRRPSGSLEEGLVGAPASREYAESLLSAANRYAPWQPDVLGVRTASGLRVLDVGCGPGIDLARFAMAGAEVTGVDLAPVHVEQARRHLELLGLRGTVLVGDGEALPFPDASFDWVVTANALQFTPDFTAAVGEMRRILRPGGEARLIVYNRNSAYYWLYFWLRRGVLALDLPRYRSMTAVLSRNISWAERDSCPLVRVHSRRQLRRELERVGFRDVATSVHGFYPDSMTLTALLGRLLPARWRTALYPRLEATVGWYLAARARR